MHDLARYLGALYRVDESAVKSITYKDKDYTWDINGTAKGSNWKSDGTSLVSVIVDDYKADTSMRQISISVKDADSYSMDLILEFVITGE